MNPATDSPTRSMSAPLSDPMRVDPDRVIATLLLAFSADPGIRWCFPRTDRYVRAFPELVRLEAAAAFAAGTVDVVDGHAGSAVWVPPDAVPDEDGVVALLQRQVDAARIEDVLALNARVEQHRPTEPHWYLLCVGVDPNRQGRGHGSALLRHGLDRCDRDGLPAYLESANPRNRELYERRGFVVQAEIRVADSPPVWPMRRPA
ncbi:MAG TPA: GNAT family N-acetyltransferase [Euzebyales bacterium]|nr:GNAT family N-acetyltransferase [Euzebyales bacterium]